jgi:hypothetical protein
MAAGIFGALSALGDFGNQLATAREENATKRTAAERAAAAAAERAAAAAEKRREFDAKQAAVVTKKPLGAPYVATGGKTMQRFYDSATQKVTEEEVSGGTPETEQDKYKRSMVGLGMTEDQAAKATIAKYGPAPVKMDAGEAKVKLWKSLGFTDAQIKRMESVEGGLVARPRAAGAASGAGSGASAGNGEADYLAGQINAGTMKYSDVPAKMKPAVFNAMMAGGLSAGEKETPQEKASVDATKQLVPMVDDLTKMLEPHKDETGLFSAFKQKAANAYYQAGGSPGANETKILQNVAFLQLLGTQPWTKTGRGKFIFEQIKPHLPAPGDSLGLIYQKLNDLKELLPYVSATPGYGDTGGHNGSGGASTDDQILAALNGKK